MDDDFFAVALRSGLLAADAVDELRSSVTSRGVSPVQVVLERGLMSAAQVDIIETLRRPKDIVPGYEILSVLGQGGMGVVYRARQLAFDRVVALKTVLVGSISTPAGLARFEQEARTIGRLVHPHIVTAYDFGRHEGRLFLAMEFVEGEDAERYVKHRGPLLPQEAWGLIRQAASGLTYAAEAGVTHRDIKPANLILVTPPTGFPLPPGLPLVKIADFGLALLHEDAERTRLTMDNATVGSPQYMAPEQLTGSRVDHRADIYALGATAYHLLAGSAPFEGKTLAQIYALKLQSGPPAITELRPDLQTDSVALVADMLAINPEQRISEYGALLNRIDALIATTVGQAPACHLPHSSANAIPTPAAGGSLPYDTAAGQSIATAERMEMARPRRSGRRLLVLVVLGLLIAGFIFVPMQQFLVPERENWLPTGWAAQCFNGVNLNGWRVIRGQWQPGRDDEGGSVLVGSGGALGYPTSKTTAGATSAMMSFRVHTLVNLHEAPAVELQCATNTLKGTTAEGGLVIRVEEDRVRLGFRVRDQGPLDRVVAERAMPIGRVDFHEVRFDCQPKGWSATVGGEFIGEATVAPGPPPAEFVLAVEKAAGNPTAAAWFSDIILEELGPPPKGP